MPPQQNVLKDVRKALRRVAGRICYHCQKAAPYRDMHFGVNEYGVGRYIHLREGKVATSLFPGDPCDAPDVWHEAEALGARVRKFDTGQPKFYKFIKTGP